MIGQGDNLTTETKTIIALSDLSGIRYECLECHAQTIIPLTSGMVPGYECQHCHKEWFSGREDDQGFKELKSWVSSLRQMRKRVEEFKSTGVRVGISLELVPLPRDGVRG